MSQIPTIAAMIPESLNEWDGHISTIIYLPGCNLRCPFCHGHRFLYGWEEEVPLESVKGVIRDSDSWIDGVVITGGEPTIHDGLIDLIKELKTLPVGVRVHTNGTNPVMIQRMIDSGLVDTIALDYKAPYDKFGEVTTSWMDPTPIMMSFMSVEGSNIDREYHTTVCPAVLSRGDLFVMAEQLHHEGVWYLQRYNPEDVLNSKAAGTETYTYDELQEIAEELSKIRPNIKVLGVNFPRY